MCTKYTHTTKKAVRLCKIADLPHLKFRMHQLDAVQNTNFTMKLISPIFHRSIGNEVSPSKNINFPGPHHKEP